MFRFRRGSGVIRLEKAGFAEETKDVPNPGRGWYRLYSFDAKEQIDEEELRWCLAKEERLALVMIDLGAYRSVPLPPEALGHIRQIFSFFQTWEKEMILRFVYDREGKGIEHEPGSLSQILGHMGQLGPLVCQYADGIFLVQGLMIGSWGEMHTSRYQAKEDLQELAETIFTEFAADCFYAVRRPVLWRRLFAKEGGGGRLRSHMGLFNDGLLASGTDLGTYAEKTPKGQPWEEPWGKKDEMEFQARLCQNVPNGGEAVAGERTLRDVRETIGDLEQMHITYLNSVYDEKILGLWKEAEYGGVSAYEYIGMHLGYRLLVRDVSWDQKKSLLQVTVENTGFAALYEKSEAKLSLWRRTREGELAWESSPAGEGGSAWEGDSAREGELAWEGALTILAGCLQSKQKQVLSWELPIQNWIRQDSLGQGMPGQGTRRRGTLRHGIPAHGMYARQISGQEGIGQEGIGQEGIGQEGIGQEGIGQGAWDLRLTLSRKKDGRVIRFANRGAGDSIWLGSLHS